MGFTKYIKKNLKDPKKIAKGLAKYGGRAILRRTGVFGIYGTMKKYRKLLKKNTKATAFKKITKSLAKKNFLRSLGPTNYIRDWFMRGTKYTLKKFAGNRLVPMQIKKLIYLNQNFKSIFGKNKPLKKAKKEIGKKLGPKNESKGPLGKINQIEKILETKLDTPQERQDRKELMNEGFEFDVISPETQNFSSQGTSMLYKWHPITKKLLCGVRSGGNKSVYGPYTANKVDIGLVKTMIRSRNYGRNVFWVYFRDRNYAKRK